MRQVEVRKGVTMGHLRLTIGYLKASVVHIRVTTGHLRVTSGNLRVIMFLESCNIYFTFNAFIKHL